MPLSSKFCLCFSSTFIEPSCKIIIWLSIGAGLDECERNGTWELEAYGGCVVKEGELDTASEGLGEQRAKSGA